MNFYLNIKSKKLINFEKCIQNTKLNQSDTTNKFYCFMAHSIKLKVICLLNLFFAKLSTSQQFVFE